MTLNEHFCIVTCTSNLFIQHKKAAEQLSGFFVCIRGI